MNTKIRSSKFSIFLFLFASVFLLGCTSAPIPPIEAFGAVTTSRASLASEKPIPITKFKPEDTIYFYVNLTWPDQALSQDYRTIEWHWLKGEEIIFENTSRFLLKNKPFMTRTHFNASDLGIGQFTVAAYLGDRLLTKADFSVEP